MIIADEKNRRRYYKEKRNEETDDGIAWFVVPRRNGDVRPGAGCDARYEDRPREEGPQEDGREKGNHREDGQEREVDHRENGHQESEEGHHEVAHSALPVVRRWQAAEWYSPTRQSSASLPLFLSPTF